ncbi:MAG: ankyrin repeat domain-containing protein [Fimbriimonas sp.]
MSFCLWALAVFGVAVAAAASVEQGQVGKRKTTDPPVRAEGRLGQELFLAIDHRDLKQVQDLLKKGADAKARNGLEFTPLHIAAGSHQQEVVEALLAAGAEADAESPYGTPLTFSALTGNARAAKTLMARGANVNAERVDGITVVMMASYSGNPELVGELLKRKADISATTLGGATALSYAARAGNVMAGKMLVEAGAKVNVADKNGQTPLMEAAKAGHAEFVKLLLENGADANLRDKTNRTALVMASSYGDYPAVVDALVKAGADTKDATAAACARVRGFSESASLLGDPSAEALAAVGKVRAPREAVASSLKVLEASMINFSRSANCVSCHHEGLGRMVLGGARSRGLRLDQALAKIQEARVNGGLNAMRPLHAQALKDPEAMKQIPLMEINEISPIDTWLLAGMAANQAPPTEASGAMAMVLAKQQGRDGAWTFSMPRAPMQSSFFTFTALAVKALQTYGPRSESAEISDRINRARGWLLKAEPKTGDDMAFRLLGLKWSGAPGEERHKAADQLVATQRPDGGWAQMPGMPSDAYATGEALYALRLGGGLSVASPAYSQGVKYLLRTQQADGTWFVNKRAIPANNYFDTGFPYGESQFASFNGTCWATLALLETFEK